MSFEAAVDWDGTIRKGFTIRTWMSHLYQSKVIEQDFVCQVEDLFTRHERNQINHDDLAQQTALIYANALKNKKFSEIQTQARIFIEEDKNYIFPISRRLINHLASNGVEITIISGAPIEVISQYQDSLPIKSIYGLKLKISGAKYTGSIQSNPGSSKEKKDILFKHFNKPPIELALGNSASDIPLFKNANKRIVVDNPSILPGENSYHLKSGDAEESDWDNILDYLGGN
ncbi:haloacid dehalogenase-like hydrolase [Marichromatium gracile]|uniref:Phosphoserine phosphatase n=1 Tax=Marichromatium gracile TaxID=1048 RepID=A0A4R4AHZ9_MARGR|nr:haloacid dehalogenase-like hydrolase [Marichromatium gracile]MBK1710527.1 hypothetical protein [Marichromatium gracile]TCW38336.1 phosphoserine phosphatase [Marichromatium gracile]